MHEHADGSSSVGRSVPEAHVGLVTTAVWFGLVGGAVQACLAAIVRYDLGRYTHLSRHVVWSAPISSTSLSAVLGLLAWLIARRLPERRVFKPAVCVYASLAALGVLFYLTSVHPWARIALAVGLGLTVARIAAAHRGGFDVLVRRSLPLIVAAIVLVGVVLNVGLAVHERRAIASLPPARPGAPNVLVLILDTVRSLDLQLYGYARATSPELERFAARGVVFDRAIAPAPWTLPSHAAMFTGRAPHELSADWRVPLDDRYPTLAEVLRDRGYLTAGFVGNLAYASTESGLNRGFVHYEGFLRTPANILTSGMVLHRLVSSAVVRNRLDWHELIERKPAAGLHERTVTFLEQHPGKPWFTFINFYDAHDPYLPPPPFDTAFTGRRIPSRERNFTLLNTAPVTPAQARTERDAYDQSIRALDYEVGRLLADLEARGHLRNTIVVITADHGEEFGEHGLLSHGSSLYAPALRVPLIIVYPGHVPEGQRVERTVSLRSLAATVLDLAGSPAVLPGESLRSAWTAHDTVRGLPHAIAEVRYAPRLPKWFPASKGDMSAVFTGEFELIRNGGGSEEIFDLGVDPTGTTSASGTPPLGPLRALLPAHPQ